ncbi:MAG TPA: hypothetical protein PKG71_03260 [Candidatus Woesebacteria bacterium]|nr:hypothetical protein [Candidatus Woesebacteria bacterium]HNS94962.1 hypothetical protein [Candidatus Woesebacteria bacterium]
MRLREILLIALFSFFGLMYLFGPLSSSAHATCKCIASDSATLGGKTGVWQTVEDGGIACDSVGKYREGALCDPLTESYIDLWFCVPTLQDLIGSLIRIIFFVAGMVALVLLLLGGFEWVSSGGDDGKLKAARGKIIHAVIGLVVMVSIMTLVVLIEQLIFGGKICLGISCPLNMGQYALIENTSPGGRASCFGPDGWFGSSAQSGVAGQDATPTAGLTPIGTGSAHLTPIETKKPSLITATPMAGSPSGKFTLPTTPPSGQTVIVLPYGALDATATPPIVLPGSGGGGGTGVPRPTVPPLE